MQVEASGFTPHLGEVTAQVLKEWTRPLSLKAFDRVRQEYEDSLKDYSGMPVSYALRDRNLLLQKGSSSNPELLDALKTVGPADVKTYAETRSQVPRDYWMSGLVM